MTFDILPAILNISGSSQYFFLPDFPHILGQVTVIYWAKFRANVFSLFWEEHIFDDAISIHPKPRKIYFLLFRFCLVDTPPSDFVALQQTI